MRILLTCDLFPKFGTLYARYLGKNLVAMGHEVHVLTSTYADYFERSRRNEEVIDGLFVHRIASFSAKVLPYVITPFAPFELAESIKSHNIDIVNGLHLVHWTTWNAFLAKRLVDFPLVYTVLGPRLSFGESALYKAKALFESTIGRLSLDACEAIIADCRASMRSVIDLGVDSTKVSIIPDGVDTNEFHPMETSQDLCGKYMVSSEDKVIAYVGSLTETKGLDLLVRALPAISKEIPRIRLLVAGNGPLGPHLVHEARDLNVRDKITFLGYVPHDELPNIMNVARLGIVPSRSEGISLALLEFMACGKPVVATNVGGNSEVVQSHINGVLVEPNSVASLADGVLQVFRHGSDKEMGENARRLSLKYDWSVVVPRIVELYHTLIEKS